MNPKDVLKLVINTHEKDLSQLLDQPNLLVYERVFFLVKIQIHIFYL